MFLKKYQMSLDETLILKGISILVIVFHNFIHRFPGAVIENQHIFLMERCCKLIERFLHLSPGILLDLISHYGHYGVPVFVFLSGYGLVVKYENTDAPVGFKTYFKRHIGKLWLLLLPLLVPHFLFLGIKEPGYFQEHWLDFLLMLGFAGNLNPDSHVFYGPWWFFSLIVQLYVVYYVFVYRRGLKPVIWLTALCLVVQAAAIGLSGNVDYLEYLRFNFVGSVLPFMLGIVAARKKYFPTKSLSLIAAVLFIACCFNPYSWLLTFGLVTLAVVPAVKYIRLNAGVCSALKWFGIISSFLFVSHPLARTWIFGLSKYSIVLSLLGYALLSILLALGYRRLLSWLKQRIMPVNNLRNAGKNTSRSVKNLSPFDAG